jgi:chemotaxis protein CheD
LRIGGTNHFLLPTWASGAEASARYGNVATSQLIERVQRLGSRRVNLQAKVFGGACVLEAFREREHHLGQKNVEAALRALEDERITVVAQDVGGHRGRKVVFHIDDGSAWVKLI